MPHPASRESARAVVAGLALGLVLAAVPAAAEVVRPEPAVASPHERLPPLQGGQNFRDLGGYPAAGGRTVRWGLLFRSGSMHFLTPADHAYLQRLGIRTVCDFRDTRERTAEPALWPAGQAPRLLADDYMVAGVAGAGPPATADQARRTMQGEYPQLLARFNGQYRRMFAELLAGRAPLAFNCSAGKDRTGIAAALLLTALGTPRSAVVDDYLLTNRYLDPAKVVHSAGLSVRWQQMPPDVAHALLTADRSYIDAALRVLDTHRGGADGYFRDELGLTAGDLRQLRRMYTE